MILLLARVCLDGLAALGALPMISRDQSSILTLFVVAGLALLRTERPAASRNWIARHRGWATLLGVGVLVEMIWGGHALQGAWGTPLASRLVSDLLILAAVGLWANAWLRGRGPASPA